MNKKTVAAMIEHALVVRVAAIALGRESEIGVRLNAAYDFMTGLLRDHAIAQGRASMRREMKRYAALSEAVSRARISNQRAERAIKRARRSIANASAALSTRGLDGSGA